MADPAFVALIDALAPKYRLDPSAVKAVAAGEGGLQFGAVGDQGTSYGPFQLHVGGALPRGKGASFANSRQGVEYALSRMAQAGAAGLRGAEAVKAIISNFERPADPATSISKALARLGGSGRVGGAGSALSTGVFSPAPQLDTNPIALALLSGGDLTESLLAAVAAQKGLSPVGSSQPLRSAPVPVQAPSKGKPRVGQIAGAAYKVIGAPGQGTHSFSAGPNNWESDNAVDLRMPVGTPLYAAFDGTIGNQFGSLGSGGRFAGLRLHLVGKGDELYYAHLSKFAPGIKPGTRVRAGQLIGYSGSANGVPHLHLGDRNGNVIGRLV